MCMIWNIPTQDDDGNKAGAVAVERISEKELSQLFDLIDNNKIDKKKFLAYMKVGKLEELPQAEFQKAKTALENIIKKGQP